MSYVPIIDWACAVERGALVLRVGGQEYNRLHAEHMWQSVLETVNGYPLRPVGSRFGRLIAVGGTPAAFTTLEAARRHAQQLPPVLPPEDVPGA